MRKVWIEAALNGEWSRALQPGIPDTVEAIIAEGVACARAGADIISYPRLWRRRPTRQSAQAERGNEPRSAQRHPLCTDLTWLPQSPRAFTSRLSTARSPSPLPGMIADTSPLASRSSRSSLRPGPPCRPDRMARTGWPFEAVRRATASGSQDASAAASGRFSLPPGLRGRTDRTPHVANLADVLIALSRCGFGLEEKGCVDVLELDRTPR